MQALFERFARRFPASVPLAQRTLLRAAARIAIVVLVASLIGYWHVRQGMETQALENLERYVTERRARESQILDAAEASLESLAAAFTKEWAGNDVDEERFSALFRPGRDNTLRIDRSVFEETGISGFVGKYAGLPAAERRTLMTGFEIFTRFGPVLSERFRNAYLVTADNAVVMYWPDEPWALEGSDWEIFAKLALTQSQDDGGVLVTTPAIGAGSEKPSWSRLYFDYGVNEWVVSATMPLAIAGGRVAALGHDLLVQDLIERVVRGKFDGAYNVLIDSRGNLIAHPAYMATIQAHGGSIGIEDTGDALLRTLYRIAGREGARTAIVDVPQHDAFVASSRLTGPDWYLMTVFPKALIASEASNVAWLILGLGLFALIVEVAILSGVLRHLVGVPLQGLANAADRVRDDPAAGFDIDRRELERGDELGRLARAFRGMVDQLRIRHSELAGLNETLQRELQQREQAERELARHRELNALLDTINYGVLFVDRDLNSRLANTAYMRMWQTPADFYKVTRTLREDMEVSRRQGLYCVADEDWEDYLRERLAAIAAGDVGPEEIRFTDGRVLVYQCTALPDGGRMLTYYDITDIKRAEEALRAHLEGMEVSMDGMALLDSDGRYTYVNKSHADAYGFERRQMIGAHWRALYDEEQLRTFETEIMPVLQASGRWRGEAVGRRRNGTRFPQELSLAVTENGGLVCVVRDITERKKRERALDRAVRQAEESNAAKSRFLASMSHELRTPLNAIIGFSRIVARKTEGQIDAQQTDNLAKIQISGEHLARLINDILDISKIEAGRTEVVYEPYAPALVVGECARTIEPMVAAEVHLEVDCAGAPDGTLGDAAKVRQILINLLSNAARHTTRGRIRVALRTDGRRMRFIVADTGPGIRRQHLEAIFEEFRQVRHKAADGSSGTGLGLTISRRLARLMGGDITVVSEEGRGATFTLELPWQPVAQAGGEPPEGPRLAAGGG